MLSLKVSYGEEKQCNMCLVYHLWHQRFNFNMYVRPLTDGSVVHEDSMWITMEG